MRINELLQRKGNTVHQVPPATSVSDAARIFLQHDIGCVLICEDDRVTGIFTKNDLLRRYLDHPNDFASQSVKREDERPLFSTTTDADLASVFNEMVTRGLRHVPVLEDGRAVGLITPIDILLYMKEAIRYENRQLVNYIQGTY